MGTVYISDKIETLTYLKNNLNVHGGVVERFKMLNYYVCAPHFHRSTSYREL